jgi:hypothetical protein
MSRVADGYIQRGQEPLEKWTNLGFDRYPRFCDSAPVDSLIPFFGSETFDELCESEKKNLYIEYAKLHAEMFIYLEYQFSEKLIGGFKGEGLDEKNHEALVHLVEEEYFHTNGFKQFLAYENLNGDDYIISSKWIFTLTTLLMKLSPACVLISGAKAESYSLGYAKDLKKAYGDWKSNTWTHINHLHYLDEVHHVPFQFEIYADYLKDGGLIKSLRALLSVVGMISLVQVIVVKSAFLLMRKCMPERSFFSRMKLMFKLVGWTLRNHAPTLFSQKQFGHLIKKYQVRFGSFYRMLYRA